MKFTITRQYHLSAIHRLCNTELSENENLQIFGLCYRFHGHLYKINVEVSGQHNKDSGLIIDRDLMDNIIEEKIIKKYQHTNLNDHFPSTSGENLTQSFFDILKIAFPKSIKLEKVEIVETHKNTFVSLK